MTEYQGACHCGGVRFRFRTEPIVKGVRCNCSICIRKGAVMSTHYIPDFELVANDTLTVYQWGDRDVNHYFCRVCGIFPFSDAPGHRTGYRVNLGCVDGIDALALEIGLIDGRAL